MSKGEFGLRKRGKKRSLISVYGEFWRSPSALKALPHLSTAECVVSIIGFGGMVGLTAMLIHWTLV